jgi:hypothetical protein
MISKGIKQLSILLWMVAFLVPGVIAAFHWAVLKHAAIVPYLGVLALFYLPIVMFMQFFGWDVYRYPPKDLSPSVSFLLLCLPSTAIIYISLFPYKDGQLTPLMNWFYGLPALLLMYFVFMLLRKYT